MAITRAKKETLLQQLRDLFKEAKGIAFVTFSGPTVMEVQEVRRALREQGMTYLVAKKTLIALAAKLEEKATFAPTDLEGPVAVIVSKEDEILPAAAIKKLRKQFFDKETKQSKFDFAGCIFEGRLLDPKETAVLANTPTREESLAKIVAALRHGPQGICAMLTHGLRGITLSLKEAERFAKAS